MEKVIYLLMDTNVWINFLDEDPEKKLLTKLSRLMQEDHVRLLVPESLMVEWNKLKERKVQECISRYRKSINELGDNHSLLHYVRTSKEKEIAKNAEDIDAIFQKGIYCPLTDEIDKLVMKRKRNGLAPFHVPGDQISDASIFFTTVEYCLNNQVPDFVFVSNDGHFRENTQSRLLHPQLKHAYISIDFHLNPGSVLGKLWAKIPGLSEASQDLGADYVEKYEVLPLCASLHLLDQLHAVYQYVESQHPYVPSEILRRVSPFKTDQNKQYTYVSNFSLQTNNEELVKLLKWISIGDDGFLNYHDRSVVEGVKDADQKIIDIYRWLSHNLIFYISSWEQPDTIRIKAPDKTPDEVEINVFKMDLASSLRALQGASPEGIASTLRHAYLQANFGNFGAAAKLYEQVLRMTDKLEHPLLRFICIYNIKNLDRLTRSYFASVPPDVKDILDKYKAKRLDVYGMEYSSAGIFVSDCISYLQNRDVFTEAFENISEKVEEIRDHYYLQLNGDYSSNSYVQSLLFSFASFETYLDLNRVIYKNYSNFYKLFDRFLEGLIMSYSMSAKQESRLREFDDYLLLRILYFGDSGKLFKYLKRYDVRRLTYKPYNEESERAGEIIVRFWSQHLDFLPLFSTQLEQNGLYFSQRYNNMIQNSLTLLAITNFEPELYERFSPLLLRCLKEDRFLQRVKPVDLANVIRDKGHYFAGDDLMKLLSLALTKKKLHEKVIFEAFRDVKRRHLEAFTLDNDEQYRLVIDNFYKVCPECKTVHEPDILFYCYELFIEPLKKELTDKITRDLKKEFNKEQYYIWSIYRMIDYKQFLKQYIDSVAAVKGSTSVQHFFGNSQLLYPELSKLLNLVFLEKEGWAMDRLAKFKGLTPYYDWLLDMDAFDYSCFNPEWILEYQTKSYLKTIFENTNARSAVRKALKKKRNPKLSALYVRYVR